jgi:rfaE bifunctional protein kinase chain/domain
MKFAAKKFSPNALIDQLPGFNDVPVLVIGDIMLDEYFIGDAQRISPEAPVPVVLVKDEQTLIGGAGNVARNIKTLGGKPCLIGAYGDGHNSKKLQQAIRAAGLQTRLLTLPGRPATTKSRILARGQQILRIDHEDVAPLNASETDVLLGYIEECWPSQRVVILSDYNKGVINKRLMEGILALKQYHKNPVYILVDPKPENLTLYPKVDLITPNTKETGEGAALPVRNKEEIIQAGLLLRKKTRCRALLTTLGSDGMALFQSKNKITHIPTLAKQVYDVTGAGDTVIGTIGLALAAGIPLLESCILANYAAGIVVGKSGSATITQDEIIKALQTYKEPELEDWSRFNAHIAQVCT